MKQKMTKEEAIHILMRLEQYIEHDEDFGNMVRSPLMDASVMAIKALKTQNNIIHCKDCEKTWCYLRQELGEDGFCSAAERKEEK